MLVCFSDVPTWLKSLRLHKYAALFSTMTYDEMMSLTEEQLEAQVCSLESRLTAADEVYFQLNLSFEQRNSSKKKGTRQKGGNVEHRYV